MTTAPGREEVNRQALANVVFADPSELEQLNRLVWPLIGERIARRIEQLQSDPGAAAILLDAAIMFEAGWDRLCSVRVFVHADEAVRLRRAETRGLDRRQWRLREISQIGLDKKRSACEYVIDNSFSVSRLRDQVRDTFRRVISRGG
jgi:dephospho-CoA kinase